MKHSIFAATVLLGALLTVGCKKSDNSSASLPNLYGLGLTQAPAYVAVGTKLTFQALTGSIYASDDSHPVVGLYWKVNSAARDTLTWDISKSNPDFVYTADTLGFYSVMCTAFAGKDYYDSSVTSEFEAVDPATVLTDVAAAKEITVKGKTWKAQNVDHATLGQSYRASSVLDGVLGKLFSWEEAQSVCPDGWHLPTMAEFEASFADEDGFIAAGDLMADARFLDEKMWEYWPQISITNKYGFNALPLGYIDSLDSYTTYDKFGEYAMWWTADQSNGLGTYLYIYKEYPEAQKGQGDKKSLAMGVRCVKD